ncbi:TIGR03617 family F420-dependent LLM class oxidoreductase [Streptomyces sp. NPDC002896]|uniref:TIGR03617 family F420-dependent LLM class oxidoreductase n=1 Tax=Streptomyces sp. NPDC002896 TaxID=3154438 RepID=UPI00332CB049
MRVDGTLGGLADAATRARILEDDGYDGLWAGELNQDPFLPLAVAAEVTDRIEVGTSIAVAFARSPMALAYTANDLQRHARGRLLLGLGSQVKAHIVRRFSMPWSGPAARMREYVLALRAIWSSWHEGTPLDFQGDYYRHTLMPRDFVPPGHEFGPPRVLLAGVGELMTRVAGEVADGFLCHGYTTARWIRERSLPALREGRARAGATMDGFEVVHTPFIATGTEQQIEAALPRLRGQIAFYASTPAYRGVFELHGWDGVNEELTTLSKAGRWAAMAGLITDEMVDAFAVVAAPDDLPAAVAERYGGLLTRISFTPPAGLDHDVAADLVRRLRACC